MGNQKRQNGIDFFRLLAALGVITVHVGSMDGVHEAIVESIRLASRWAVPFFFMLTGFFLALRLSQDRLIHLLSKASVIFVCASILLFPLSMNVYGVKAATANLVSFRYLINGTYFHLWYLSSLILGLLIIIVLRHLNIRFLLPAIAAGTLATYLIFGSYAPVGEDVLRYARHLSSVGFIYLGIAIHSREVRTHYALTMFLAGFIIQFVEGYYINEIIHTKAMYEFQFLLGTLLMSLGIFFIAKNMNLPHWLGTLGAKHSLVIYLIHPYFIQIFKSFNLTTQAESIFIIPFTFIFSLLFSYLLFKLLPKIYFALNGDLSKFDKLRLK